MYVYKTLLWGIGLLKLINYTGASLQSSGGD